MEKESIVKQHFTDNLGTDVVNRKYVYYGILLTIGLINNTGYVLVGSASQQIANNFQKSQEMGFFNLSLILFSSFARTINSKYLINVKHQTRITYALLLSSLSYLIIGISTTAGKSWGFYVSLLGSILCGCMQAFGESVMLGYLRSFPPSIVGGWSSGTGLAGPFGAGLNLALTALNIEMIYMFIILIPLNLGYYFSFRWLQSRLLKFGTYQLANPSIDTEILEEVESENVKLTWANIKLIYPIVYPLCINLALVYFLEYSCLNGFSDRAHVQTPADTTFLQKNAFTILFFCYQIGVFLSRTSLYLFKIKNVTILTILQAANFVIWCFIAIYKKVPMGVQIPLMFYVGLLGGASYVNVNHQILNHEIITQKEKELAVNISGVHNDTGVLLASIFVLINANFIMPN